MKILMVLEETPFLQPQFVADLLSRIQDDVVSVGLVTRAPGISDTSRYLLRNLRRLYPSECLALAAREMQPRVNDILDAIRRRPGSRSVRSVVKRFGIDCFEIQSDINKDVYIDRIRAVEPDVIYSSQPLLFKDQLLALPKLCCLNRHSSMLPAFAGLWPLFHALRCCEEQVGVTIHTMERKIDAGTILAQRTVAVQPEDSMASLYGRCFVESVSATIEALDKVRSGETGGIPPTRARSYFSFPNPEHWREFRARGRRII